MADTFSPAMERFFEELRKTPREWVLVNGEIQTFAKGECDCPTTYLFGTGPTGLDDVELCHIWCAADRKVHYNPALRARLLECCGLTEVKS